MVYPNGKHNCGQDTFFVGRLKNRETSGRGKSPKGRGKSPKGREKSPKPKTCFFQNLDSEYIGLKKSENKSPASVFSLLPYPSMFDQFSRNSRLNDWWLSQCDPTQRNQTFQIEFCRHYIKNADNKKNR